MRLRAILRLLWRDLREGELTLLLAALVLAVATVSGIALFVDRLERALLAESAAFLGGDRRIEGGAPVPGRWLAAARARGLATARTLSFTSMAFAGDRNRLVSVKAVGPGYPLRGILETADDAFVPGAPTKALPTPGTVWVDGRLLPTLDVAVGEAIEIGAAALRVERVLTKAPDRGGGPFELGPRVLMRLTDVPATEVVQPGSRLEYALLLRGPEDALEALRAELSGALEPTFRWQSVQDTRAAIGRALERARRFLLLGGLLAVVLAGVAIALAAHRHGQRQQDPIAVLKTLGVTPGGVTGLLLVRLAVLGTTACAGGLLLGAAGQSLAVLALRDLIPAELPPPGAAPLAVGAGTGLTCLAAFAGPPLLRLRTVPPVHVLRRERIPETGLRLAAWGTGAAAVLLLMLAYSRSVVLTGWLLLGTAGTVAVFLGAAAALLRTGHLVGTRAGSAWRLGLARLQRRRGESQVQILVFGLAILLLLVLTLLRTALVAEWRAQVPRDAPDHFALNIGREEIEPFTALLREGIAGEPVLRPTLTARITAVNGTPVDRDTERGRDLFREHTLSTARALPEANALTEGRWWGPAPADPMQVSVAEAFARGTGLAVGDRITFGLGGLPVEATVTSLRAVEWDSLQANFLFLLPPRALADYPATWVTAFHLEVDRKAFLERLLRRFPTVTVIEVDAVVDQIQRIVDRVTLAVEGVLGLVLVAGILVLIAAIRSSLDERLRAFGLLRALGAGRRHVRAALLVEFGALGAGSGLLAAAGAEATTYLLATRVFELAPTLHPWVWLAGPALGIAVIGGVGTLACRPVLTVPPARVLRETAGG